MASSWEYPSLNRMSQMTSNDSVGEYEGLPSRIDSNKPRSRFDSHSKDNKRGGQGKFSYDNRKNNKGHNSPPSHKRHGSSSMPKDERMDYSQPSSELSNLSLPLPGPLSSGSVDKPPKIWEQQTPSKKITDPDWNPSHISNTPEEIDLSEEEIKEELFPPNKIALLQENLDTCPDLDLIGLEYVIEVQHNSVKNLSPVYYCLLCDEKTKTCEKTSASLEQVKIHLRSVVHKGHYIEAYFPTLKKCLLSKIDGGVKSSVYRETISGISQKITSNFGKMNIKIVIGLKLFERRQQEIKKMIDNSTHFRENKEFLNLILGNSSLANSYEKAFSDFEAELRKKNNRDRNRPHTSYNDSRSRGRNRYRSRRSRSRSPRPGYERKSSSSRNSYEKDSSELAKNKNESKSEEPAKKSVFVDILANRKDHSGSQRRNSSPIRGRYNNIHGRLSSNSKDIKSSRGSPDSYDSMNRGMRPSLDKKIEKYIEKEKILNETLEKERKEYLNFPHTHRKYNEEWENFYVTITSKRGITDPEMINQEWVEHWKAFFFQSFDMEARKRRDQVMIDHHITSHDLDKYYVNKAKSLEEQLENRISTTKPTGEVVGYYTNSAQNKLGPSPTLEKRIATNHEDDNKEVTVISTFRLLSALESILDDLGPTVIYLLAKANSMEVNEGFGSSSKMVNEQEVFIVFWKAREKLDYKLKNQLIDGSQAPTSQVCIKNINILIKKSKCELPQEMCYSDANNESSVKAAIAKTVVEQFVAQGKPITESQLASIVEMEYDRVKDSIPTSSSSGVSKIQSRQPIDLTELSKKPEKEELVTPNSEEDLERMTCHQLANIFKRFREFNKITRCRILDYMKKIEKTNPARVTEMKKIIHSKA
ncbi:uncharacterized protein [Lepeophtheirus salmonis]|uniref:uncharacterized protein isoform X1 n=2 Tax=Lepeophtheirus salmonis TaxID=72036 RepID=UPI001AE3874A|nr:uncharacterized protein LOC121118857 isoform X1 [Lepeophtheirus salmonis]XP_040569388.1 uncharacterized protein LOC121118857 isoform X1 [Lepeophtheirus salmonis]